MEESINVVVKDSQQDEVSDEEEEEVTSHEHNVTRDVPEKGTNIIKTPEDEQVDVPTSKRPSTRIHKYHPIENVIINLNEEITTKSKEVMANMCFISKMNQNMSNKP